MWGKAYWTLEYWAAGYWAKLGYPVVVDGVRVFIAGVDRTALVRLGTLSYSNNLEGRANCAFTVMARGLAYYRPVVGDVVEVYQDTVLVFGGTIDGFTDEEVAKNSATFYGIKAVDYGQILDRYLVAQVYEGWLAGDIVRDIIDNVVNLAGETIGTGGIQDGFTIERIVFGYRKASDCIRELSKLTGFSWYVDQEKILHFFDRATFSAPFGLSSGSANYRDLKVDRKRGQYRNRQYVRAGNDMTDPRSEEFHGDDKTRTFTVAFEVAKVPSVYVNTVAQTVGVREVDDATAFEWYWAKGDKQITQRDDDTPLGTTDVLEVEYRGLFPIIVVEELPTEILARSIIESGGGVYENIEDDSSIESSEFAAQKADGLLRRFGVIPTTATFETDVVGLRAGMLINVNLPTRGSDLDDKGFLIDSVRSHVIMVDGTKVTIRHTVDALGGEFLGSWFEFFRKLQDAGRNLSLREGEKLLVVRSAHEAVQFAETFTTADPLGALADDVYTGFQWGGSVTDHSACWGTFDDEGSPRVRSGSQFVLPRRS